ncbi:MAG: alpha/beta hydrolase [Pseudomonadota bacterium]
MQGYGQLLDDEIRAFIARTAAFYPPDAVDLTIAQQRAVYDRMCAEFDAPHPAGLQTEDRDFGGVPCRVYTPTNARAATIFFCHGGGFVVGGLHSHDSICAELAEAAAARLVAVDYRMSPEHPFPDDFEDAWAAFQAVSAETDGPIVLCGDSAGGNLVAAVAHHARGRGAGRITGQVLIYPGLGGARDLPSYTRHADAPGLTTRDMDFYRDMRAAGADVAGDPRFAPLADGNFSDLPETVVITAECDPLSSDGEAYAAAITAAGGSATWIEEAGLIHGYLRARHMSHKARESFARIGAALHRMATP